MEVASSIIAVDIEYCNSLFQLLAKANQKLDTDCNYLLLAMSKTCTKWILLHAGKMVYCACYTKATFRSVYERWQNGCRLVKQVHVIHAATNEDRKTKLP